MMRGLLRVVTPLVCLLGVGCSSMGLSGGDDGASAPIGTPRDDGSNPGNNGTPNFSGGGTGSLGIGSTAGGPSSSGGAFPNGPMTEPNDGAGATSAAGGASGDPEPQVYSANPFVITAHDPLSTFAADSDTASYDIFTSSVSSGSLPPAATVRLEEFVNYFHYGYEPPKTDAAEPFSITLAAAPALDPSTLLMRVGIQGRMPTTVKRPANLVFLVDVSGSMGSPLKLPLAQYTMTKTLGILDPTDKVSIVTYSGHTAVALPPTPVAKAADIEAVIDSLIASGGTDGGQGIQLAYKQAESAFIKDGINHVMLCTDGDFNLGITDPNELVNLIVKERESGITFTGLGFGADPNDSMMERVSDAGNGTYSVLYSKASVDDYTQNRLLGNLDYIAKDMKIQVEFNPDKVYAYRLLGYEDRAIADNDFRNDVVDAGEVGAGHRVTALYQLVLAGGAIPAASMAPSAQDGMLYSGEREVSAEDYALVKVRYKAPDAKTEDPAMEVNQPLQAAGVADSWSKLDADFQWAYAVASFAEILKGSPYATPSALNTIGNIINQPIHDDIEERVQFRQSFDEAKPLIQAK